MGARGAWLGGLRAAALLARVLPARRTDEENEALLERVNATGEVFLSHTRLDGSYVLRLAIGNAGTNEDDVRVAWDVLRREAEQPRQPPPGAPPVP